MVRDYWDSRPCNIRHSDLEVGTREYFDEVEKKKYFVEPHIPIFAEFEKWRGKKVLEIGCGIGTDAVQFARAGADYTGIDISEVSVNLARKRFEVYGLNGTFYVSAVESLRGPWDFDLVYAFGSIHHCLDPDGVVDMVYENMRHGSEFRLMLYATNSYKRAMIHGGFEQCEAQGGCPVVHTFTNAQARSLLSRFQILSITQDHIFPFNVSKYVKHKYELLPWFACMPADVFAALQRELGWHMLIKCKKLL